MTSTAAVALELAGILPEPPLTYLACESFGEFAKKYATRRDSRALLSRLPTLGLSRVPIALQSWLRGEKARLATCAGTTRGSVGGGRSP